jgi:hypothetical protein
MTVSFACPCQKLDPDVVQSAQDGKIRPTVSIRRVTGESLFKDRCDRV